MKYEKSGLIFSFHAHKKSGYTEPITLFSRYLAITHPLKYDEDKVRRRLPLVFVLIWVYSFIVLSPDYFMSGVENGACILRIYEKVDNAMIIFTCWLFVFLLIPSAIMITTYVRMYQNILASTKSLTTSSTRDQTMKNAQTNVVQTCVIVCIFFICTMTYNFVCDALIIYQIIPEFSSSVWNTSVISVSLNSSINPYVYSMR